MFRPLATITAAAVLASGCTVHHPELDPRAVVGKPASPVTTRAVPHAPLSIPFARAKTGGVRFTNTTNIPLTPGSCHAAVLDRAAGYVLPDPACTPGAVDPAMTRDTLCAKGFTTKTRRPYSATTNGWEAKIGRAYGYTTDRTFEGDHFVPLSLGGVNDVANFWAQPNSIPPANPRNPSGNPKDAVEVALKASVCAGRITLAQAQKAIVTDWVTLARAPRAQLDATVRRVAG